MDSLAGGQETDQLPPRATTLRPSNALGRRGMGSSPWGRPGKHGWTGVCGQWPAWTSDL